MQGLAFGQGKPLIGISGLTALRAVASPAFLGSRIATWVDAWRGDVYAALFEDGRISGVIDFYFAGVDCWLYDIAVCANDWCLDANFGLERARTEALFAAYEALRPLAPVERAAWPVMLRAAALRFWLSRLHDFHLPRPGMLVHAHDPEHFRKILECRRAS